jgi:hypothetical protein
MSGNSVPALVRFVRQRPPHGDCGVANLATLAQCSYEEALAAIVRYQPAVLQAGLNWPEMLKAAKRLGLTTRLRRTYDITEATGILRLRNEKGEEHFAFLWAGRIVDSGEGWEDPGDYLRHYGYTPTALLTTED